jgi:hypothetical protein
VVDATETTSDDDISLIEPKNLLFVLLCGKSPPNVTEPLLVFSDGALITIGWGSITLNFSAKLLELKFFKEKL